MSYSSNLSGNSHDYRYLLTIPNFETLQTAKANPNIWWLAFSTREFEINAIYMTSMTTPVRITI